MRVLGFDTASRATTVAVVDLGGSTELEARDDPEPGTRPRHTACLMPLIVEVLQRAGWTWDQVDRIAVGVGPGTFTGLRIGVATARALAQARSIPLVGISTLQSLALGATEAAAAGGQDVIAPVLDARRQEVFTAGWPTGRLDGPALTEPVAVTPSELAEQWLQLGCRTLAVGDGAVEFRAVLEPSGAVIPSDDSVLHRVSARHHCRLASERSPARLEDVVPEYLRPPDAELSLRARVKS